MGTYHSHKGMKKSHPITTVHKNKQVQKWHNESVKMGVKKKVEFIPKYINVPIKDGWISLNLTTVKQKGLRVSFHRQGKTVGLEIAK